MKGRPENSFLEQFSERFMDHVRQVCTFAKLVPGFKCLHHDDQVTLLKSCVFEVLLVRLAGLFENQVSDLLITLLCTDDLQRDTVSIGATWQWWHACAEILPFAVCSGDLCSVPEKQTIDGRGGGRAGEWFTLSPFRCVAP